MASLLHFGHVPDVDIDPLRCLICGKGDGPVEGMAAEEEPRPIKWLR